jgi:glycine cleavage system H protein
MVATLVALTVVACIVAHLIYHALEARGLAGVPESTVGEAGGLATLSVQGVCAPEGAFLDTGHTWVRLEQSGQTRVGLDDFVRAIVGKIDKVKLPALGQKVRRGQKLFSIRQGEREAAFVAPVDGVVASVNGHLVESPEDLQSDSCGEGWVCTLTPRHLARNLHVLLVSEESNGWLQREVKRFQRIFDWCFKARSAGGKAYQNGGEPTRGVLEEADRETWNLFVAEFLKPRVH